MHGTVSLSLSSVHAGGPADHRAGEEEGGLPGARKAATVYMRAWAFCLKYHVGFSVVKMGLGFWR